MCVPKEKRLEGYIHPANTCWASTKGQAKTWGYSCDPAFPLRACSVRGGTDKWRSGWLCECEQCNGWETHGVQWSTWAGHHLGRGRHRTFITGQYRWPLNSKGLNCEVHLYLSFFQQIQTTVLHSPLLFESTGVETQVQTANCKVMRGFSIARAGLVSLTTRRAPPMFKGRLCA